MFRSFVAICLIALGMSVAVSISAYAEQEAYTFTPPQGWTATKDNVGTLSFVPPGASDTVLLLLPPSPLEADFEEQAARARATFEAAMKLSNPANTPPQRGQSSAGEHLLIGGTYSMPQGNQNIPVHMLFFARGANGAFGFSVFVTGTNENYAQFGPAATAFFNGLQFTDVASKIAAERGVSQEQKPQSGTAGGMSRDQLFDQCVRNCGGRLMVCTAFFRPQNAYLPPCTNQNQTCLSGCYIFKAK